MHATGPSDSLDASVFSKVVVFSKLPIEIHVTMHIEESNQFTLQTGGANWRCARRISHVRSDVFWLLLCAAMFAALPLSIVIGSPLASLDEWIEPIHLFEFSVAIFFGVLAIGLIFVAFKQWSTKDWAITGDLASGELKFAGRTLCRLDEILFADYSQGPPLRHLYVNAPPLYSVEIHLTGKRLAALPDWLSRMPLREAEAFCEWLESLREYESIPADLRLLSVEKIVPGRVILLREFDAALMCDIHSTSCHPKLIVSHIRGWRAACQRLAFSESTALVRHHHENVLMVESYTQSSSILRQWLDRFNWNTNRSFKCRESTSLTPLEDGYFRCLHVVDVAADDHVSTEHERVSWSCFETLSESLPSVLERFTQDEEERLGRHSCEDFLLNSYDENPDQGSHPAISFFDFSEGVIVNEFAGSVWSATELRFWSRPVQIHK